MTSLKVLLYQLSGEIYKNCWSGQNLNWVPHDYKSKIQAATGPDGSRRFRLPDFMTIGT